MHDHGIVSRHIIALIVIGAGCAVGAAHAQQSFPSRPVRLIVPFTPGAINDLIARLLAARLAEGWRQQVVVDNRPGAGTRTRAVNGVPACGM